MAAITEQNIVMQQGEDRDIVFTVTTGALLTLTAASADDPVSITTREAHNLDTGDFVKITGVKGNEVANVLGNAVTVIDADTFTLDSIDGTGQVYTGGGLVEPLIDLTGFTAEWTARRHPLSGVDSVTKATGGSGVVLTTPTKAVVTVSIDAADTTSLEPRVYDHEMDITDTSSNKTTIATGTLTLQPSIT